MYLQVVPETCCILDDNQDVKKTSLFTPKDASCTTSPNSSNSYMNRVCQKERAGGTLMSSWADSTVTSQGSKNKLRAAKVNLFAFSVTRCWIKKCLILFKSCPKRTWLFRCDFRVREISRRRENWKNKHCNVLIFGEKFGKFLEHFQHKLQKQVTKWIVQRRIRARFGSSP